MYKNFASILTKTLKHEYQEGTVKEVRLNCARGDKLWVNTI